MKAAIIPSEAKLKITSRLILYALFVLVVPLHVAGQEKLGQSRVKLPVLTGESDASGTTKTIAFAIYTHYPPKPPLPSNTKVAEENFLPDVIFIGYKDGTIVWSDNAIRGSAQLKKANIDPSAIEQLLEKFKADGFFDNPALNKSWRAPGSGYTSIYVNGGERSIYMRSWHELVEDANPKAYVISKGAGILKDNRSRSEELMADMPEYVEFRTAWSQIKRSILSLVPQSRATTADSEKVAGIRHERVTLRKQ